MLATEEGCVGAWHTLFEAVLPEPGSSHSSGLGGGEKKEGEESNSEA